MAEHANFPVGDTGQILVCDDDPDARSIIKHSLTSLGHTVVEASDGSEAIELCKREFPDVIVMDIMMPGVTGTEFVKWLRAEEKDTFTPVLFLTALTEIADRVEGLQIGADDYLTKPFNYLELQARVQALLRIKVLTQNLIVQKVRLQIANDELSKMQKQLIEKERELVAVQLGGAAAHNLGQPLTTILLNCVIIEKYLAGVEGRDTGSIKKPLTIKQAVSALDTIKGECEDIQSVVSNLKEVDANLTSDYVGDVKILDLQKKK